jgi:cytoskeletal protein CcmA (bactofilin family)
MKNKGELDGYLGPNVRIQGDLFSENTLRFDGSLEGTLVAKDELIMGTDGRVRGQVVGRQLSIAGHIEGDVYAIGSLELLKGASIHGQVCGTAVQVRDGAVVDGRCLLGKSAEGAIGAIRQKYNLG